MKKIGVLVLLIASLLIAAEDKEFNLRDFYNKTLENSPQSPNDFQLQDTLGKIYPQEVIDSANSQNPENFYDGNVDKNFGPKTTDKDDIGAKGIGSYLNAEKQDIRNKLIQVSKEKLGGVAKSTGRVSCYITRSQSFFKYHCPINNRDYGFSSSNPTDSPLSAKSNCEAQCYDPKATACVAVTPLSKSKNDDKEVKQEVFNAIILSKKNLNETVNKVFDKNLKVKYFEFSIKNNVDVYLDFSYEDETGFQRIMAKNLLIKASGDEKNDLTIKEIQKKFYINSKVAKVHLELHIGKLTKNKEGVYEYEKVDLSRFADDEKDKDKEQLIVEMKNGILFTPQTKRFACRANDVGAKRHLFTASDLTDLVASDGSRLTIAKSASSGDNEDGTFSDEGTCSATCRVKQECVLVQPELNIEEFFGFTEDCATSSSSQCTKQKCIDARENGAPIVNETVYDAQGNAIQTISNGNVVAGAIRPRLLAVKDKSFYNEKIKEEAKDRAYDKMLKDHKYVTSIPIKNKRETAYAVKTKQNTEKSADGSSISLKNKTIDILVKPGSEFSGKKMYLYVLMTIDTSDVNYTFTDKNGIKKNYRSRFYAMVDENGNLEPSFFSEKGIQWLDKSVPTKIRDENKNATTFRVYDNVFEKIKENNLKLKKGENRKFYIQERLFDDKEDGFKMNTTLCSLYGALCPAVIKGYLTSGNGASVSTYETKDGKILSGVLSEEIYENPGKKLPQKNGVKYLTGDIPLQYTVTLLASSKPLTYKEIAKELIDNKKKNKESNENVVYNYLENPNAIITDLKDDSLKPNENIFIYLFGDDKKLSAYASFKTEDMDFKEAGYSYYWWGEAQKDEDNKSIVNLKPSKKEPFKYYPELPRKETFIPLFEDLDISMMKNENLNFGYSTGRYSEDDCRVFKTKNGLKTVCLPWWGIERDYAEHKEPIADSDFQKWAKKYTLPLVGKIVNVCTKVDPYANSFYNNDKEQKVNCTSYYDKNKSAACKANPFLRECFVDTCPAKVKENCELSKTNDFDAELPALFIKNTKDAQRTFGDGKVGLKSYTYNCPTHTDVQINQVCLKEEQVKMSPANCNVGQAASDNDKIRLKSNYIYCSTNNPIIDASGKVTGFRGTCPNTKKEVVCGIDQVKEVVKTCTVPVFVDEPYTEVKTEVKNANCQIYSISVIDGEGDDVYKNDPTCLRDNDAADSRKGILKINFMNENVPKTFIVSKNYKDTQEIPYCQYDGFKSPRLPSGCKNASEKGGRFMDFSTTLNDSKEIIFAEQIGHLDKIGGITLNLEKNFSTTTHNSGVRAPTDFFKNNNYEFLFLDSVSNAARERIGGAYHNKELDFSSQKLTGEIGIHPFTLMPESLSVNYKTSKWFQEDFKVGGSKALDPFKPFDLITKEINCDCISNNCDATKNGFVNGIFDAFTVGFNSAFGFTFRCHYHYWAFSANKVYENSTLGLNILFPTPSSYEVTFFNKDGDIVHTQTISRSQLTSVPAGVLQSLAFGGKIRTPEQKDLDTKIEKKEKEIAAEKERIAKLPPIKKVKLEAKHLKIQGGFKVNGWRDNPNGYEAPGGYFENCRCTSNFCDWGGKHAKRDYTCAIARDVYYVNYDKDASEIEKERETTEKENEKRKDDYANKIKIANTNISKCKDDAEDKWNQCEADKRKWLIANFKEVGYDRYCFQAISQQVSNSGCQRVEGTKTDYESEKYGKITIVAGNYYHWKPFLESDIDCSEMTATAKKRCETKFAISSPTYLSTNISKRAKVDNKAFYDKLNGQHLEEEYTKPFFVSEACAYGNYDPWEDDCGYWDIKKDPTHNTKTKDGEICVSNFDPSKINDPNYNIVVDCSPYASDLEKMEAELEKLKKDLRSKTHNCESDPFSPIGGGTIFGLDSINEGSCDLDRGEKFIADNAIMSIRIVDLETKDITTKKLEFPLVFPNRVYFTYLKAVEDRRYKCCTLLN